MLQNYEITMKCKKQQKSQKYSTTENRSYTIYHLGMYSLIPIQRRPDISTFLNVFLYAHDIVMHVSANCRAQ